MDYYDNAIISTLREDARTPFTHIAAQLGVSEGMIRARVQDLINRRVIVKFTIETNGGL